ncbi:MAG TPA: hypothetical protein ENK23_05955 [Sorangium sp.]|nr:hypothetical protein [Sorangium sp.]
MKFAAYVLGVLSVTVVGACGGGMPAPSAEDAAVADAAAAPAAAAAGASSQDGDDKQGAGASEEGIPTQCAGDGEVCFPPPRFVKALCSQDYPAVAVVMFGPDAPWTHAYTAVEVRAWNAAGGGASNEKIPVDEEVLIVRERKVPKGGMQVSGVQDSYDVMRWDGSCVTLDKGELRFDPPRRPKNARIVWKRLEIAQRDALKEEEALRPAYLYHRKHCKGVSMGVVSKECVKADAALSEAVAAFVRNHGQVPTPSTLPQP